MSSRSFLSNLPRVLALSLALGAVAPLSAAAQEEPTPLQRLLGNFGLLEIPGDNVIEYRDRAPLVVPPSTDLPVPSNPTDIRTVAPDWPTDPEVLRAAARKEFDKKPIDERRGSFYSGQPLRPDELRRGTVQRRGPAIDDTPGRRLGEGRERLPPGELNAKGLLGLFGASDEKPVAFTAEPPRTRLTEPPPGYQTPSPNAPYGVVEKDKPGTRIGNPFDRLLVPGDTTGPQ